MIIIVSKRELIRINNCPTDGSNLDDIGTLNLDFPAPMQFLALAFNISTTGGNNYIYSDMSSVSDYTIQSGDYLEYDFRPSSYYCGFDYTCSDGTTLRDSGITDQNSFSAHPAAMNSSFWGLGGWCHRKFNINAHAGKTIQYFDVVCEGDTSGNYYSNFANIVITNNAGTIRKTILSTSTPTFTNHLVNNGSLSGSSYVTSSGRSNSYNTKVNTYAWCYNGLQDSCYISYNSALELSTFSISSWFYLWDIPSHSYGIMGTRFGSDNTFDLKVESTRLHGDVGDGTSWLDTGLDYSFTPSALTWYHVVYVLKPNECKIYLNSILVATHSFSGTPKLMKSGQSLYIGNSSGSEIMHGVIDDFRIFGCELTRSDIMSIYKNGNGQSRSAAALNKKLLMGMIL